MAYEPEPCDGQPLLPAAGEDGNGPATADGEDHYEVPNDGLRGQGFGEDADTKHPPHAPARRQHSAHRLSTLYPDAKGVFVLDRFVFRFVARLPALSLLVHRYAPRPVGRGCPLPRPQWAGQGPLLPASAGVSRLLLCGWPGTGAHRWRSLRHCRSQPRVEAPALSIERCRRRHHFADADEKGLYKIVQAVI